MFIILENCHQRKTDYSEERETERRRAQLQFADVPNKTPIYYDVIAYVAEQ